MLMGCFPKFNAGSSIRPRYKRLVDNIYPASLEDAIMNLNMHKLRFYALSSPDELCLVAEYLCNKALVDVNRSRYNYVKIAMIAMDRLLMSRRAFDSACFVETFLEMNRRLLENENPKLQLAATESFLKFASMGEDTPSYHRRYDVFVSRYSAMCQMNVLDNQLRISIRMAGLRGLESVIKKTVSDDLVQDIWESQHMKQIIPALIFNMQNYSSEILNTPPSVHAGIVFRYLISKSSFDHVQHLMEPLLNHFDSCQLWIPNEFPIYIFKIVMLSIEPCYSYKVINIFLDHLNEVASARIKASIAGVLTRIISIGSGEFIGHAVYEIVDKLLKLTNDAIKNEDPTTATYRDYLVESLEQFSINQPDYQKVEIMSFVCSDLLSVKNGRRPASLMEIVLKCMVNLSERCTAMQYQSAFPKPFMDKLMNLIDGDFTKEIKILTLKVMINLLDRHKNCSGLKTANMQTLMKMQIKSSQNNLDVSFANKNVKLILDKLTAIMTQNDDIDLLESAQTVASLLIVELGCVQVNQQFLEFLMNLQDHAKISDDITAVHRLNIHKIVIVLFAILSQSSQLLQIHCQELISRRQMMGSFLLPPLNIKESPSMKLFVSDELLLDQKKISEHIQETQTQQNVDNPHSIYLSLGQDIIDAIFVETQELADNSIEDVCNNSTL